MGDDLFTMDAPAVPKTFQQLGVLVLDGSGSMGEQTRNKTSKAQDVNGAVRELLTRLKASRNRANFTISVITFDDSARTHTTTTDVIDIDDNASYDPLPAHGGGTNIGAGGPRTVASVADSGAPLPAIAQLRGRARWTSRCWLSSPLCQRRDV